jgi:hypothetical protein
MNARIIQLTDAVVSLIKSNLWPNMGANDAATRSYGADIGLNVDDTDTLLPGRQVYVYGTQRAMQGLADRGEADNRYTIVVQVFERYVDAPAYPTTEWMDERVNFVEQSIFKPLSDQRTPLLGTAFPDLEEFGTIDFVYDITYYAQYHAFFSQVTLHFQEIE